MITFEVYNNDTLIQGADSYILSVFDVESRYPSPLAIAADTNPYLGLLTPGGWDGWIRLLRIRKTMPPAIPTGLYPRLKRVAEKFGYGVQVEDKRVRPEEGYPEPRHYELRDYQEKAVEEALKEGRGVLDLPPRSGKTRIMVEITRRLALPTIWLAPTDRIVTQTMEVLRGFFGENYAYQLVGSGNEKEAARRNIVLCTTATAISLSLEFYLSRKAIVIDELHHSSAKSYKDIFHKCDHIFFRFGCTGTFYRSGEDAMAMHAHLSNVVYKIESKELLERKILVPTEVVFLPVLSARLRGVGGKAFNQGHGKMGIHEHDHRNELVSSAAVLLAKSGRKTLVLVGTKVQGRAIQKRVLGMLGDKVGTEFRPVEFVSTDTPRPITGRIIKAFNDAGSSEIQILIGTSLVGEGVDLPLIEALVYARGEKAEVSLMQSAYRVCTASQGKHRAVIVDFADRHNAKLLKHSLERLEVYNAEPTFSVRVLADVDAFLEWLKDIDKGVFFAPGLLGSSKAGDTAVSCGISA